MSIRVKKADNRKKRSSDDPCHFSVLLQTKNVPRTHKILFCDCSEATSCVLQTSAMSHPFHDHSCLSLSFFNRL